MCLILHNSTELPANHTPDDSFHRFASCLCGSNEEVQDFSCPLDPLIRPIWLKWIAPRRNKAEGEMLEKGFNE